MKKLLTLLFIGLISFTVYSQERTVTKDVRPDRTYYKYTGVAADTLISTNQDTIDLVFQIELKERITKIAVKSRFDVVSGADTTVAISVDGKIFSDDSYTSVIASTLSGAVTANNTVKTVNTTFTEAHVITAYDVAKPSFTSTIAAFDVSKPSFTSTIAAFDVPFTNVAAGTADTLEFPQQTITIGADTLEFPQQTITIGADTLEFPQQSITVTPADYSYRYIRVRYIIQGDDSVGTGIKIDEVELKLWTE